MPLILETWRYINTWVVNHWIPPNVAPLSHHQAQRRLNNLTDCLYKYQWLWFYLPYRITVFKMTDEILWNLEEFLLILICFHETQFVDAFFFGYQNIWLKNRYIGLQQQMFVPSKATFHIRLSDVTYASKFLKSPTTRLFVSATCWSLQHRITSRLGITGSLTSPCAQHIINIRSSNLALFEIGKPQWLQCERVTLSNNRYPGTAIHILYPCRSFEKYKRCP